MDAAEIADVTTEGTILEGPHGTEPVRVLTAKSRGKRIEVQAVGTLTKKLWTKLLNPEEFGGTVKITGAGKLAALDGNPTHFRLAAEAHRIRLAFQYDPHFAVSVSQVDPLPHQMDEASPSLHGESFAKFQAHRHAEPVDDAVLPAFRSADA